MAETIQQLPITYQDTKKKFFMTLLSATDDTDYLYVVNADNSATLIRYLGDKTNVKTPRKIDGHTVKYISSICYNYNSGITSITIRDGVQVIE